MLSRYKAFIAIAAQGLVICTVAYTIIISLVLILPHFPLGNKKYFKILLRSQMTLDQFHRYQAEGYGTLMLLGSSTIERGVNESTLDSSLLAHRLSMRPTNSAGMGMFAKTNANMLQIMIASGIRPSMIIYGFFVDELNGRSQIHDNTVDSLSAKNGLKPKTFLDLIVDGPKALSIMLNAVTWPVYIYMLHHAYNDIDHRNLLQRLIIGGGIPIRDSSFQIDRHYLRDFSDLCVLCRNYHIPLALCNTPINPTVASNEAFPYAHRIEAYNAIEDTALFYHMPIWNADAKELFDDDDYFDINHLNAHGAKKLARMLGERIAEWSTGIIRQEIINPALVDSIKMTTGNSVIRTLTQFNNLR